MTNVNINIKYKFFRIPSVSGASIQRVPVGSVSTNPLTRPTIIAPQVQNRTDEHF